MNNRNISSEILSTATISQSYLFAYRLIMCVIGIPINLYAVGAIICNRDLRSKPRNIFLVGIFSSNLSFFVPVAFELIYWESRPAEPVFAASDGIPYVLLLSNMCLALIDRFIAIKYTEWYEENMTSSGAGTVVVLSSMYFVLLVLPDPNYEMQNRVNAKTL